MKGIPPEIDQLMWTLAEEGNQNAQEEFVRRYPTYRQELLRRRETLSGLKTSRPKAPVNATRPIPRFTPKEVAPPRASRGTVATVGVLALAALALASYTVTTMLAPAPAHSVEEIPPTPATSLPLPKATLPRESTEPNRTVEHSTAPENIPPDAVPPVDDTPKWAKPQNLVIKRAGLVSVLQLLGASSGLKVVVAPGMPNPTIAVEYHDTTPIDMLRDLGHRYAFTPFDQGDGSVVVYPVVEKSHVEPTRHIGG